MITSAGVLADFAPAGSTFGERMAHLLTEIGDERLRAIGYAMRLAGLNTYEAGLLSTVAADAAKYYLSNAAEVAPGFDLSAATKSAAEWVFDWPQPDAIPATETTTALYRARCTHIIAYRMLLDYLALTAA